MADDAQDRRLPASERKIRRAREDGQVARSRDLGHLLALGAGGAALAVFAPRLVALMRERLAAALRFDAASLADPGFVGERLARAALDWLAVALPVGAAATALGIAAALGSGGWNFTWKPLRPNFGKLDVLKGLGQIVSMQRLGDLGKASALALAVGAVGAWQLWRALPRYHDAIGLALPQALALVGTIVADGLALALLAVALAAVVDVPLQRAMLARRLRMSVDEAKREHKEQEGDPHVKGRIRQRMRDAAKRRMLAKVPEADLVVTNPTHYAVALKYDEATMNAPRVVAKGVDLIAAKIREVAAEHGVALLEAPPLARALYAHTELDREVPARLYTAVAQVLAHVWRLKAAMAGQGAAPGELPDLDVPADLDPAAGAAGAGA